MPNQFLGCWSLGFLCSWANVSILLECGAVPLGARPYGTVYWSHFQGLKCRRDSWTFRPLKMRPLNCLETSSMQWHGVTFQKDGDHSLLSRQFYSQVNSSNGLLINGAVCQCSKYLFNQVPECHGLDRACTLFQRKTTVDKLFLQAVIWKRNPNVII